MINNLIIKNLKIFAYHGVNESEKENGQNFLIDAEIFTDKLGGYEDDKLENVLNLSTLVKEISAFFKNQSYDLIERAAECTVKHLIQAFPQINEINFTLKKPEAPIFADFEYVAVKISRKRSDYIG